MDSNIGIESCEVCEEMVQDCKCPEPESEEQK